MLCPTHSRHVSWIWEQPRPNTELEPKPDFTSIRWRGWVRLLEARVAQEPPGPKDPRGLGAPEEGLRSGVVLRKPMVKNGLQSGRWHGWAA